MTFFALIFSIFLTIIYFVNNNLGAQINMPHLVVPKAKIEQPVASPSAKLTVPKPPVQTIQTAAPAPWGTTEKLGDHLYRTYVAQDPIMGTPSEILSALNNYRHDHGQGTLQSDDRLCTFANQRASDQQKMGTLDAHAGFKAYLDNPDHWKDLNMTGLGENASYGYVLSGVHLIEWVFDSDEEHKANQLNSGWQYACAGVSGVTVDIIFGKR